MTPLEAVLDRLESARRVGKGYQALCPAHEDRRPSLGVTEAQGGQVLVRCHAGCRTEDVVAELGMTMADLFPASNGNGRDPIIAEYDYVAEDGTLLFQVVRLAPKSFRQRSPKPGGGWEWSLNGVRRVPFRLPHVVEAARKGERVYVVEGERDVLALERLGQVATCNPGGVGKWRAEYAEALRGAQVVAIADRDDAGREHARQVAASLEGVAADVEVVEPAEGKDIADHLTAGRTLGELVTMKTDCTAREKAVVQSNGKGPAGGTAARGPRRVILTAASAVTPESVRWLWHQRLPLRGLSLIAGEPGLGKSTLTAQLAADVTRGRLPGDLRGQPADVLIATAEDHFGSVVWGRLMAAGADMDRVHRIHVEDRGEEELLTLPDDVAELELRCEELAAAGRPVALLAVDPVTAFIGGGVDTHRDAAVRRVLAPLSALAERQRLAAVGIAHLNKDTAGKLLSRVGGSVAFGAAPRSVLAFARHPDDADGDQGTRRVIVQAKSNHGRYAPSLAARIESREIDEVGEVSRLVIDGECEVGPDDLGAQSGGDHHDLDAAVEWLVDELADGQWHESREVKAGGKQAGHSERTLERARGVIEAERDRRGFPSVAVWRLPVPPTPSGATGGTEVGGTGRTRIPEPKAPDPPPSPANARGLGGTEAERPATAAEEAEIERVRGKFPVLNGGAP